MYFNTIAISALAAAGFSSAAPAERRAPCLVQPPSTIGFPINYNISTSFSPAVSFQIPPNSVGPCQLVAKFPAGYPISHSGSDLVNVRATNGNAQGSVVGTLRFMSSPGSPTRTVINSFSCSTVMSYQLEIADGNPGWVAFQDTLDAGLFMEVGDAC